MYSIRHLFAMCVMCSITASLGVHALASIKADPCPRLHVCTSKACKKQGSRDTLRLLRELASTAAPVRGDVAATATAAELQDDFARSRIHEGGCLGKCGMGPNVGNEESGEVFYNVFKPASARALLQAELGLEIAEAAAKASVKRMYAERARRAGDLEDAHSLLTAALNLAGTLRTNAVSVLRDLLLERAEISESMGNGDGASADRARAEQMITLRPEAATLAS